MKTSELAEQGRKLLALDEAIAKLHQAGLAGEFLAALEKDHELKSAVEKLAPQGPAGRLASAGWSCCITVSNPQRCW